MYLMKSSLSYYVFALGHVEFATVLGIRNATCTNTLWKWSFTSITTSDFATVTRIRNARCTNTLWKSSFTSIVASDFATVTGIRNARCANTLWKWSFTSRIASAFEEPHERIRDARCATAWWCWSYWQSSHRLATQGVQGKACRLLPQAEGIRSRSLCYSRLALQRRAWLHLWFGQARWNGIHIRPSSAGVAAALLLQAIRTPESVAHASTDHP